MVLLCLENLLKEVSWQEKDWLDRLVWKMTHVEWSGNWSFVTCRKIETPDSFSFAVNWKRNTVAKVDLHTKIISRYRILISDWFHPHPPTHLLSNWASDQRLLLTDAKCRVVPEVDAASFYKHLVYHHGNTANLVIFSLKGTLSSCNEMMVKEEAFCGWGQSHLVQCLLFPLFGFLFEVCVKDFRRVLMPQLVQL